MTVKTHTGITFTIIGLLLPFFGSVCLASAGGYSQFLSGSGIISEKTISFDKQEIPASTSGVKQDVDFIHRLKNSRFLYRKFANLNKVTINDVPHPELSFGQFSFVPKPAYYNYLFLFKPF